MQFDAKRFITAIKFASHFVAKKDIRHYLNGVLIEFTAHGCTMVATTGQVLCAVDVAGGDCAGLDNWILPIASLLDVFGKCKSGDILICKIDDKTLRFTHGAIVLDITRIDGVYPEWRRVVPKWSDYCTTEMPNLNAADIATLGKALALVTQSIKGVFGVEISPSNFGIAMRPSLCEYGYTNVIALSTFVRK